MVSAMARTRAKRRATPSLNARERSRSMTRGRSAQAPVVPEPPDVRRLRRLVAIGVGLVASVAYLLTAARDIFPGDTPEFISVALTGGVAHPPGYPLISIIGAIFGQLAVGPLPFRIGLISVLCHAATVTLVFLTAERLTRSILPAAAAALVLAFGTNFWSWSLVAETFPLNDLLAALAAHRCGGRLRPRPREPPDDRATASGDRLSADLAPA